MPARCRRKAREGKGMSLEDVAGKLKLSRRQIEALEADNFSELPGLTFCAWLRRNYARVLDIDPDPILAYLDAGPQTLHAVLRQRPRQSLGRRNWSSCRNVQLSAPTARAVKLIAALVLAALLAGGGALLVPHQSSLEPELTLAPASRRRLRLWKQRNRNCRLKRMPLRQRLGCTGRYCGTGGCRIRLNRGSGGGGSCRRGCCRHDRCYSSCFRCAGIHRCGWGGQLRFDVRRRFLGGYPRCRRQQGGIKLYKTGSGRYAQWQTAVQAGDRQCGAGQTLL